jgi:hypothetical protein
MKILPILFIFALLFQTAFAAPLIFKKTVDSQAEGFIDVGTIDTLKYSRIRIKIQAIGEDVNRNEEARRFTLSVAAVEGEAETNILTENGYIGYSAVIDTPPSKTRIKIQGKGKFQIFVWASE